MSDYNFDRTVAAYTDYTTDHLACRLQAGDRMNATHQKGHRS